jgi:hypothetical protein
MHKLWVKMVTLMVLIAALVITFNYIGCGGGGGGSSSGSSNTPSFLVTTNPATNITRTAVTLNGVVNPNGVNTTIYFQYGKTLTYGSTIGYQNVGSGMSNLNILVNLTGLQPNTIYNYRIRASRSGNTSSGVNQTFTTAGLPPDCVTGAASNITSALARLNGTVNPNGIITTAYFDYGISATPIAYPISTTPQAMGSGISNTAITTDISGLSENTAYNFRAVANNSAGKTYGNNLVFVTGATPGSAPTCNTDNASNITFNSARLNGTVNPNGITTTSYFQYGLTTSYTVSTTAQVIGDGLTSVAVSEDLTGLLSDNEYNFRVVGVNTTGTSYGSNMTFTTPIPLPTCTTGVADRITSGSARFNGTVNPNGLDTTVYFEYRLTTTYNSTTTVQDMGNGLITLDVTATANSLVAASIYNFRIVGTSSSGTSRGIAQSFNTLASLPYSVTSNPSTSTDYARAVVTDSGYLYIAGYEYNLTNYQWRIEKREKGLGALVSDFGTNGVVVSNPSTSTDYAYAMAADADYLYVAGTDCVTGTTDVEWRVEKRDKTTGALVNGFGTNGAVTNNPTPDGGSDYLYSITTDNNYLYLAGYDTWADGNGLQELRVEKRDKITGALVNGFGINGVVTYYTMINDWELYSEVGAWAITNDSNYLYIAGLETAYIDYGNSGDYQWHIEKRDKTTGALAIDFGTSGVITSYAFGTWWGRRPTAYSIVADNDYIYVGGNDLDPSSGAFRWCIEKRNKSNGLLLNVERSDPNTNLDEYIYSMVTDNDYLYIAGYDKNTTGSKNEWRIEKRNKSNLSFVNTFGINGVIVSNPVLTYNAVAYSIIVDSDYLYAVGSDYYVGTPLSYEWRIEKRYLTTGGQ